MLPPVPQTKHSQSLGVKFRASPNLGSRVTIVGGFSRTPEGGIRAAEASGVMVPGQLLYRQDTRATSMGGGGEGLVDENLYHH